MAGGCVCFHQRGKKELSNNPKSLFLRNKTVVVVVGLYRSARTSRSRSVNRFDWIPHTHTRSNKAKIPHMWNLNFHKIEIKRGICWGDTRWITSSRGLGSLLLLLHSSTIYTKKILYYYKKRIGAERTPGVENEQPQIDRPTGWHGGSKFISPPFLLLFLQMIPKSCALMAKYTADRFQWEVR